MNLTEGVVGGDIDGDQNLWNFYWLKTALLDLNSNPFYTDHIYYPLGTSLRFHTLNPLNGLIALPVSLTLGYVPATNLVMALALFLNAFFTYLLLKDLTNNSWASFAGAALFAFANRNFLGSYLAGQTERVSAEWLPLYLLFMFRAVRGTPIWNPAGNMAEKDDRRWSFYSILAVVTLLCLSLTDWQYLMQAVLVTILYGGSILFTKRPWQEKLRHFGRLAIIGGGYTALVALPLFIPMVQEALSSPWLAVSGQAIWHSLDLLEIVEPGLDNPGYAALALVLLGVWATLRKPEQKHETAAFWVVAGILSWVMALGPVLIVGGQPTGVPLPYALLQELPLFSIGRDPQRFYVITLLAMAIFAAFGLRTLLTYLLQRPPERYAPATKKLLPAALVSLLLVTTVGRFIVAAGEAQVPTGDPPAFYARLADDKETYAILELPMFTDEGKGENTYMAYQAIHKKQRFSGRLSRDHKLTNPNNIVKLSGLFRQFWLTGQPRGEDLLKHYYPEEDFLDRTDYEKQAVPLLNYYNVRYIILYKDALTKERWTQYLLLLKEILGSHEKPHYEDQNMQVYKVPVARIAEGPFALDVGNGWFPREVNEVGLAYRWADQALDHEGPASEALSWSEFYVTNLRHEPVDAHLNFTIYTFKNPRTIHVSVNGKAIRDFDVMPEEGEKPMSIALSLPPGNSIVSFSSTQPPIPTGDQADSRLLSFGMYGVSLQPK